jgi:hypothetical protein
MSVAAPKGLESKCRHGAGSSLRLISERVVKEALLGCLDRVSFLVFFICYFNSKVRDWSMDFWFVSRLV